MQHHAVQVGGNLLGGGRGAAEEGLREVLGERGGYGYDLGGGLLSGGWGEVKSLGTFGGG